ncbi:MAG: dephospho-CoA kinase [Chitinophagales bacterium]|nr:dephospho-CoA kinase [Chitinophagales bacterium]
MNRRASTLKVGITGGIGSGKTTICNLFEDLGIPIYNADNRAKFLMHTDPSIVAALKSTFGGDIYNSEGILQRALLAKKVFNNHIELDKLNKIVHPRVRADFESFIESHKTYIYIIQESALMIETGAYKNMDAVVLVVADLETRINRVMERDHCSREEVLSRISNQMTDEEKTPFCQYIIHNNPGDDIESQVEKIHHILCEQ